MSIEDKIKNLTAGKAALVGGVVALLYYMVLYDDGSSKEQGIQTMSSQLVKVKTELSQIDKTLSDASRFEKLAKDMGEEVDKVISYLPINFSATDMMKMLSTEAKASGSNIVRVRANSMARPGSHRSGEKFYEELKVSVELEGTYSQLLLFLSFLTRVDKIITMDSLTMTSSSSKDGANLLKFGGDFVGYRYLEQGKK